MHWIRVICFPLGVFLLCVLLVVNAGCAPSNTTVPAPHEEETGSPEQEEADLPAQSDQVEQAAVDEDPAMYVVVEPDILRLRSGPGTEYEILDRLEKGLTLEVLGESRSLENELWFEVVTPRGKHGWVHGDYVSVRPGSDLDEVPARVGLPYTYREFGLESIGLHAGMTAEEVIGIMGEPLSTVRYEEGPSGPTSFMEYDGLVLGLFHNPEPSHSALNAYVITLPGIPAIRGVAVGDTVEKVLQSFLIENEEPNRWKNPDAEFWSDITEHCVELYFRGPDEQGLVMSGLYQCDEYTGEITLIGYSHYLPASCAHSGVSFAIEDGQVVEINLGGF